MSTIQKGSFMTLTKTHYVRTEFSDSGFIVFRSVYRIIH